MSFGEVPEPLNKRMAKDLLRRRDFSVGEVAERVGYGSASTFSTAFRRHVGQPPSRYSAALGLRENATSKPANSNGWVRRCCFGSSGSRHGTTGRER